MKGARVVLHDFNRIGRGEAGSFVSGIRRFSAGVISMSFSLRV